MRAVEAIEPPDLPPREAVDIQARIQASLAQASQMRVVIATVLNPFPLAIAEVRLLLRSLRLFGGRHAEATARVHVVGAPNERLRSELHELGAQVRVCEPFHPRCQTANKLGMLEDIGDADYLLMLDNDIVIGGDITPHLVGADLGLKPECVDHLGMKRWQTVFSELGLSLPSERVLTTIDSQETVPYFNSGVILVPRSLIAAFRQGWEAAVLEVLDLCTRFSELAEVESMADQVALAICLARQQLPRRALPIAMNFHTRFAFHPVWNADTCQPVVLHHHHALTSGCSGVALSSHRAPNRTISAINAALMTAEGQPHVGRYLPSVSRFFRRRR